MDLILRNIRKIQRNVLDHTVRSNPRLGLDLRAENFVELFAPYLPSESRILDIGGGWGFYAEPLARRGHQVTVLDVVKPGFQKAPVVVYEGGRMPFADKSFDASLLITVLHHIPNPEAVIREARRVTRKTLIVIEDIYQHSMGRWWTILRDMIYNFEFVGHPCQFKKAAEWIEVFKSEGFSLQSEHKIYTRLAGMRICNGLFIFKTEDNA